MPEDLLSLAVASYVSGGHRPYPAKDEEAVVEAVGEEAALRLLPRVQDIAAEVFEIAVDWSSVSREPYVQVQDAMRSRHPELSEPALRALIHYFAYQTK